MYLSTRITYKWVRIAEPDSMQLLRFLSYCYINCRFWILNILGSYASSLCIFNCCFSHGQHITFVSVKIKHFKEVHFESINLKFIYSKDVIHIIFAVDWVLRLWPTITIILNYRYATVIL